MNCDINYEDPPEENSLGPIPALKMVSWKKDVASYFKAPQECVGQRKNPPTKRMADRRSALKHPCGRQNGGTPSKQRTTETVDAGAAAHII